MDRGRTRVSYQRNPNFCERIGQSLIGILIGSAILIGSSVLIFWNEGRAVQTAKSLDEGLNIVVSLDNPNIVSAENHGKLVHLIGSLQTDKELHDEAYNINVHAVKLRRVVEMFQWEEHETERKYDDGNGETRVEKEYSYSQVWRSSVIVSRGFDDSFNHRNPTEMPVPSKNYAAQEVTVGQFVMSYGLKEKINNFKQLGLSDSDIHTQSRVKVHNDYFYHSDDVHRPQIGDTRVKFEYAGISGKSSLGTPDMVTIVARQIGEKLLPYKTVAGDTLELLYFGSLSPKAVFDREMVQNTMFTWGLRFVGWLLMFIGFTCLTSIVTTLVDWIPIVRDLVTMGVCLMNLSLSISLSLTIIAIGWIFYRPLLGFAILAMAATPFIMSQFRGQPARSRMD
ncbi:transmembrane protein 43-like [Mya arenaria]|uniref:transmembrane protein 43-like n=1 Tax=Mya arenaria TaxID=6604 RepID=UPI0022E81C74|nr:transmembrane protein 43-like [Mya arenaria]